MLRVEIWIFTTLFACGVIGGMTYLNLTGIPSADSRTTNDASDSFLNDKIQTFKASDPEYTNSLLQSGDRYLIAGNYALALDRYFEFEKAVPLSGTATLLRQALCNELQHEYARAETTYNLVITSAPNIHHQLLGIAGSARCLAQMGKRADSMAVLSDQALKIDQYRAVPDEILAQLIYEYANVLLMNSEGAEINLLSPNGAAFGSAATIPELQLEVIDETSQLADGAPNHGDELKIEILQRPSNSASVITVSVSARIQPVLMLISQLSAASDLELLISERATIAIQNRAKTVQLRSIQLSTLLDTLLAQFGLVWYQLDGELHVVTHQELDAAIAPRQFWYDSAQRAFRHFELRFQDNFRRNLALLSRANLSLVQNRLDAADNQYQELAQAQPGDEVLAKLFFNQAKLQMLFGRSEAANQLLFLAIDQTLEPEIESSGYCLLGENLLATGDLDSTIRSGRRGLATAVNPIQKQSASLTLARAYLLNNDPFSANNVLFENRASFAGASEKNLASILGTYARYIGVKNKTGVRNARNRLFSAVAMIPDSDYASFADCYLAAHAYRELGFVDRAISKYLLALSRPDVGAWQRPILYELAMTQKSVGRTEDARTTLQGMVDTSGDLWSRRALRQLAEIFADNRQTSESIEACKKLWQLGLNEEEKQAVLQILGTAYQQQGEHHSAALCFAGLLPDTF